MQFSRYEFQQFFLLSGDEEIRTLDPLLARQVLSQLSYIPSLGIFKFLLVFCERPMGLSGPLFLHARYPKDLWA